MFFGSAARPDESIHTKPKYTKFRNVAFAFLFSETNILPFIIQIRGLRKREEDYFASEMNIKKITSHQINIESKYELNGMPIKINTDFI